MDDDDTETQTQEQLDAAAPKDDGMSDAQQRKYISDAFKARGFGVMHSSED